MYERLLIVAHGTASAVGAATARVITDAVRAARPAHEVDLCFLDVIDPRLADALDDRPTIAVPALLSTGFHVLSDIPTAVAPYPRTRVTRHLGPDPLLTDALIDRLGCDGDYGQEHCVVLAASGSSRLEAAQELSAAADLLGERLRRPVRTVTVGRGLGDQLSTIDGPLRVATYLLAEGVFLDGLREAVGSRGTVAPPLGPHPAIVELVWKRYDELAGTR